MSQRQRDDMVLLAHIREQHKLSLGSYGRPRMSEELKELGLKVGHRRVGRLMRQNGIEAVRTLNSSGAAHGKYACRLKWPCLNISTGSIIHDAGIQR